MSIRKTYLRYECADAFSLTCDATSSFSSASPDVVSFLPSASPAVLLAAGSQCVAFDLNRGRPSRPVLKVGHRDPSPIGTGRALNSDVVTCLDVAAANATGATAASSPSGNVRIATGWNDGAVRIFDVTGEEFDGRHLSIADLGAAHSLLGGNDGGGTSRDDEFACRDPLALNGHTGSPVTCVAFDKGGDGAAGGAGAVGTVGAVGRLASGGADGSVVVWDVVAETGLFRLLGHRGAVTHLSFVSPGGGDGGGGGEDGGGDTGPAAAASSTAAAAAALDGLVSSSLDGLVKIWDLGGQCCMQTLTGHGGEVWSADCALIREEGEQRVRWRIVTGASDAQLRVWALHGPKRTDDGGGANDGGGDDVLAEEERNKAGVASTGTTVAATYIGSILRQTNERASLVKFSPDYGVADGNNNKLVGVLAHGSKNVEVYRFRSTRDAAKRRARRLRRRREKKSASARRGGDDDAKKKKKKRGILDDDDDDDNEEGGEGSDEGDDEVKGLLLLDDPDAVRASDEMELVGVVRSSHRVRGFGFAPGLLGGGGGGGGKAKGKGKGGGAGSCCRVVLALGTNAIEVHSVSITGKVPEGESTTKHLSNLDMYGHPTGIRSISLSSDESMACTVSKGAMKVWNVPNRSCIRSLPLVAGTTATSSTETGSGRKKKKKHGSGHGEANRSVYGLCCAFLPGNSHVVVGTREGRLLLIDVASGDIAYEGGDAAATAHDGAIWSIDVRSDGEAVVSGSADHSVKFWDLERDETSGKPRLVHTRTLKMNDDVVAVRYSRNPDPSKRLVAASSLDCTVKVFFDDTLKFFLSLYGHKLPALALDCSDDDAILASGGADKSIKIWGLDFGDTHRTLYGHDDSITDLRFIRRTHNFFTCGKDKTVRYWDGDRFEQILLLSGHAAEVNTMAVSRTGGFVLTGGMDRQVRVWERTKDIVFIEEEKERELENIFDKVDGSRRDQALRVGIGIEDEEQEDGGSGERLDEPQSEAAVKRSVLSVAAGDRIVEALEMADREMKEIATLRNSSVGQQGGEKKRSSNPLLLGLEPPQYVLWVLRSVKSSELEQSLLILPMSHMERLAFYLISLLRKGMGVELCSRVAVFLVQIHQKQIVSNHSMGAPLRELRRLIKLRVAESRDMVGFNLAALKAVARLANSNRRKASFLAEETTDIWAGLGLGSDVAAALERTGKRQKKR